MLTRTRLISFILLALTKLWPTCLSIDLDCHREQKFIKVVQGMLFPINILILRSDCALNIDKHQESFPKENILHKYDKACQIKAGTLHFVTKRRRYND